MSAAATIVVGMYLVADNRASINKLEEKINILDEALHLEMKVTEGVILGSVLYGHTSDKQNSMLKNMM